MLDLLPEPDLLQYESRLHREVETLMDEAAEYYEIIRDDIRSKQTVKVLVSKGVQTEDQSDEEDKDAGLAKRKSEDETSPPASKKTKTDDGEQSESKSGDAQATDANAASTLSSPVNSQERREVRPKWQFTTLVPIESSP